MKSKILLIGLMLPALVLIHACKKEETAASLDAKTKQFNEDSNNFKSESDQIDNDINNALGEIPGFGKGTSTYSSPLCGVTIDSSQINQKILFFNFDGITPCFSPSRTRGGQIKVQLTTGNLWSDVNAILTITYINFKITRLSDNKFIVFNGTKTLKNMNGNNWLGFLAGTSSLKYQQRAFNIQVSFNDGASAVWNTARITTWSYEPSTANVTFTSKGDTALNGFSNVDSWGTNRFNTNFTTYYNTPILSNTYCGLWRPKSGDLIHRLDNSEFRLTLGLDQNGNQSTLNCAYGYRVSWTSDNGKTYSILLSY